MQFYDIFIRSTKNILRNKSRNIFLSISLLLGITSFLTMLFIGSAFQQQIYDNVSAVSTLQQWNKVIRMVKLTLGLLGIIAFLVSIGTISNTINVTLEERSKEIGMLKILGANNYKIIILYWVEYMLLSLFSLFIGLFLSIIISISINSIYYHMAIRYFFSLEYLSKVTLNSIFLGSLLPLLIISFTVYRNLHKSVTKSYLQVLMEE